MKHQAIVETVFKAAVSALPDELGALLGQTLKCKDTTCSLLTKEDLFAAEPRPKSTLAKLKITGEHEGTAFLILPVKTSVIFGGTLIMLPQDQINENAEKETLDGEVADAYGEVANILAGVLTQVFLDKYPKNTRFVRTDVEELAHASVDVASDKPFPPGNYFLLSTELEMGKQPLGRLEIITPAALLDLEDAEPQAPAAGTKKETAEKAAPPAGEKPAAAVAEKAEPAKTKAKAPFADAKKLADVVLKATVTQVAEEVGALLGQAFAQSDLKLTMVSKEDFFGNHCTDKSSFTSMDVSGATTGKIYLLNLLKDAILMGGTLIMLPEDEIQEQMSKGKFEGEVADAYGEVANIISGGLTQTFQDRYPQPLRFVKTTTETVIPTKIVPAEDRPFPDGLYYMADCAVSLQGKPLGRMYLLFPAAVLGLDNYAETGTASAQAAPVGNAPAAGDASGTSQAPSPSTRPAPPAPPAGAKPVVLVIADSEEDVEAISRNLADDQYDIKVIGYKDDVRSVFSSNPVLGVFLLMSEVGDKGFSVAIKLQSSGYSLPPVIAGGPEWTRTAVLKAVKYGARDILVTPATDDEIREKVSQHIAIPA